MIQYSTAAYADQITRQKLATLRSVIEAKEEDMGTKADPGEYDCYSKAESDEPMFVLLARDPLAPILVELWADMREIAAGKINKKSEESRRLAAEMRAWRWKKRQS